MPDHRDPHLVQVRYAHGLRVRGWDSDQIAEALGIKRKKADRVAELLAEYDQRRKARTLFEDIDRVTDADMYTHMSIMTDANRAKTDGRAKV